MTIEIKKENHYIGLLFADIANPPGDILGTAWREPSGKVVTVLRVRFHVDSKVFDSEDVKRWYEDTKLDAAAAEAKLKHMLAEGIQLGYLTRGCYISINGDGDAMAKELMSGDRPWVHTKQLTPDEARAEGYAIPPEAQP
jgi:hypothetical protein